jgi:alpha-L-rhamnosidase
MHVSLRVPVGCTATMNLPGDDRREVGHGEHQLVVPYAAR